MPTLIIVESHIGYGAPHKHDTSAAHGEPLGEEEIRLAKRSYGWPEDAKFLVPDGVREHFRAGIGQRGRAAPRDLVGDVSRPTAPKYPDLADQLERMQKRELPDGWDADLPSFPADSKGLASRELLRQGAERHRGALSLADRRLGRSRRPRRRRVSPSRPPAISRPANTAAAICISAFASTPWARS